MSGEAFPRPLSRKSLVFENDSDVPFFLILQPYPAPCTGLSALHIVAARDVFALFLAGCVSFKE
jgi:hypothetical protein